MRALLAALLVCGACSACGGSHGTVDGGDGGGGSDATDAMIDADPNVRGTVTLHVIDKNGAPVAGLYVVWLDTDSTVTEGMTDASGMAQASVYPNASVTAVRVRSTSYSLVTVRALNPGDAITLYSAATTVSSSEDAFSNRVVPMPSADIAASPNGAAKSGSTATFTTLGPHGLVAGDRVLVANVAVAGYNGAWTVATVPTATTFTANLGSGGLSNSGTGLTGGATATKAVPFTVNYAAYAGVDHYEVHTRCATTNVGSTTAAALDLPVGCAASPLDIEVHAKSSAGVTLASTQQAGVTVTAGGSTTIGDTWHPLVQLTAAYTNPTTMVTGIAMDRYSPYMRGTPVAQASGPASPTTTLMPNVSLPARAVISSQFTCAMGTSPDCLATGSGSATQTISQVVDGTQTAYALDVGANLLPWIKALYVPQTTTLQITTAGTAGFDIVETNLRYTRGQAIYTWRVFGPVADTFAYPALPATAPGDPTIRPSDVESGYQAFIGDSDAISGYRDAIKSPFEALGTCESSASATAKPYAGTKNRLSQWN